MRIAIETDHILYLDADANSFFGDLLQRIPAALSEASFVYHNDDGGDWPEGVESATQFETSDADLCLYLGPSESFSELPTICFLSYLPPIPKRDWFMSLLHRFKKYPEWYESDKIKTILVPTKALQKALVEQHPELAGKVRVAGFALPSTFAELPPADSVTRRITKEVYGREKSFFLAPSTGHESDNLERLVQAYDRFRQRCPEEVMLLIGGTAKTQLRAVRRAVKSAKYRADISFLPQLSAAEYWKVYSSARAILYPTLSAKLPIEILRAWHARVPVLAVDNDVLMGGGAQVQGEDVKSMVEALLAIVTTPFLASGLVDNGTRRLAEFTWEKVAARVAQVLREFKEN